MAAMPGRSAHSHGRELAPSQVAGAGLQTLEAVTRTWAHSAPMGGEPHPALLVVQSAGVAVEAAVVQLLLLVVHPQGLLAWREVLEPPGAHELLRSQLLLLLRGQLPLELGPCRDAQRSQALRVPAARPHGLIWKVPRNPNDRQVVSNGSLHVHTERVVTEGFNMQGLFHNPVTAADTGTCP